MNKNPLFAFEELSERLGRMLPPGAERLREDLRRNFKATVQSTLDRMDLVTREEFDIQRALLARTRARLEELEQRVAEMESAPDPAAPTGGGPTTRPPG